MNIEQSFDPFFNHSWRLYWIVLFSCSYSGCSAM